MERPGSVAKITSDIKKNWSAEFLLSLDGHVVIHYFQDHTVSIDLSNLPTRAVMTGQAQNGLMSSWFLFWMHEPIWHQINLPISAYFLIPAMYRRPRFFCLLALAVCFSMRRKIWKLVVWCGSLGCCKEPSGAWACICSGEVLPFQRCFVEPQPRPKKPRATMLRSNAVACTILELNWTTELDVCRNVAAFDHMYVGSTGKPKVSMTGRLPVSWTSKVFSPFTGAASAIWT